MPICALAAAARRSAAAMSGRRSSSCEGTPRGTLGREIERRGRNAEAGEFEVGDGADGVLKLGAGHADVDELGAHGFKLGAGLGDVGFGGDSAGKAALGQVELVFEIGDGGVEQLGLRRRGRGAESSRRPFRREG